MTVQVFSAEILGTMLMILMGGGVVANVLLAKTKGHNGGTLMINFGWGLAVFAGVWVAAASGAHLNPAVTVGIFVNADATEFAPGVAKTLAVLLGYVGAQFIGAMLGALLCFVAYKQHFDAEDDPALKLAVFSTGPAIRHYGWNLATEIIATFVLVLVIAGFGSTPHSLGPLAVALLVVGIGASLGGPTGYAINPARDLGPRIVHALLPIKNKGTSDWSYAWVPVLGPLTGGTLGGLGAMAMF